MTHLFSTLKIRGVELKNRIMVSPMCQYSSEDGYANDWHMVHLGSRAVGGSAIVMTEATAVSPEGRISPRDLGIWKDEHIEGLAKITRFITEQGAIPGMQLAHAGRKASHAVPWSGSKQLLKSEGGWQIVGPSPMAFSEESDTPEELSEEGIKRVINAFRAAALRAKEAGFKIIEIHGAHGYLINEFLSPFSNKRTDKYGGSFENRIRFLTDIAEAIRSVWEDEYPLFVRISATEWKEGGWTVEDSIALANVLKGKGVDLMDCSSGGNILGVKIPLVPGYQVPLSEAVRSKTGMLTGAVGLITKAEHCESILAKGQADVIVMAREMLRDPYFPQRAAYELGHDINIPNQYLRAKPKK